MRASLIPLFAEKPSHSFVPLGRGPAGARSEGQGRPTAGAPRAPLTAASTLAGWRRSGVGAVAALVVALLALGAPPLAAAAQEGTADRAAVSHPYAVHVADAARRFGIPEAWIWAVMRVESNGNSRAVSRAGAMGLMQIMPTTWAELRMAHGLGLDPFDVRDNIVAGAAYLRAMHDRYGDAVAMLAAYNAGPGRYDQYLRGRPLPAETRAYLTRLASITGDTGEVGVAAAPPPSDPFAWRRGALFVRVSSAEDVTAGAQSVGAMGAAERSAEPSPSSSGTESIAAISSRPIAPADALFVPRAGAGRPQ